MYAGIVICAIGAIFAATLCIAGDVVQAQNTASQYDPSRYPDWSGGMRFTARGVEEWPTQSKDEVARTLIARIVATLATKHDGP